MFLLFGGFRNFSLFLVLLNFQLKSRAVRVLYIQTVFYFIFDFSGTRLIVFLGWGVVVLSLRCVYIMFLVIFR